MQKLNHTLLASACVALLGAAGLASSANASTTCYGDTNCSLGANPYTYGANDIFGGGSSLIAPYWRQTSDCYAQPADLITKGTPPTYVDEDLFDYSSQNCANTQIDHTDTDWYISTGSGSGILGVFGHDPVTFWGEVNVNGPQYFPEVFYANSDAGLGSNDVNAYTNGGVYSQGSTTITIAGQTGGPSCTSGSTNPYPNPYVCYGPMVQFPLSIDPVAIAYANDGVYEKIIGSKKSEIDYSFNVQGGNNYGGLKLSVASLCGIYNGQITNWNDSQLTADNNNTSLKSTSDLTSVGAWSVPLYPVARSDSSGTTSIITRHLANVCAQFGYNLYTTGATTISGAGAGSLIGNTYNVNNPNWPGVDEAGKITIVANSSGVAQYVAFTQAVAAVTGDHCGAAVLPSGYTVCIQQGRVGYDGADYVLPYVGSSQTNVYNLFSAAEQNYQNQYVTVSPKAASIAFGSVLPPQTTSKGKYDAGDTANGYRNDPTAWVEDLSPTEPLANPTASGSYPIVGTTNMITYSCFANADALAVLSGEINYQEKAKITTNAKKGILAASGLSPLPKPWLDAIDDAFVVNKDKLGLQLSVAGSGGTAQCKKASGA
jgi:ABC-type phosphate transport system substrate-binding protein